MGRTHSALSPRPEPAVPPSPPSSTRKRQRESTTSDATTSRKSPIKEKSATEEQDDTRPTKKSRRTGVMDPAENEENRIEVEATSDPTLEESIRSTGNSSDTMTDDMTTSKEKVPANRGGDAVSPLDSLSVEERRKLKGKGKATETVQEGDDDNANELARMSRELAFKNSLIASQAALLSNFRSTVACMVCLETLDKPYALGCGHVFCRKCLLEWFLRPDPTADENRPDRSDASSNSNSEDEDNSDSSSSSSSSSSSPSASQSRSGRRSSANSGSESDTSSYVGGSFRGQEFRIRNTGGTGNGRGGAAAFNAISNGIFAAAFGRLAGRAIGGTSTGGGAGPGGSRDVPRITEAESESGEEEETGARAKEADAEEMRKARLARFGGGGEATSTTNAEAQAATTAATDESNQPAPPARSSPRARPRSPSRSPPPPPRPKKPLPLPKGEHRSKNLVCPQCRTPCSERAPHRIFVLSELLSLVRTAEESGMLHQGGSSSTPAPHHDSTTTTGGAERTDLPGLAETDQTWGGLFPGTGGTESAKDRRRRLATVVRDRDDGVTRCGECNWEIDQRSGMCEGCGRTWAISDDGSISSDDSGDDGLRFRFGRYDPAQRALARRHHALEDSERSDDSDSDRGGRGIEEDDYESDDFLVRSGDEEDGMDRGRGSGDGLNVHDEVIWSDDGDSEVERKIERREARRRRERRQQGEVIDPGSDTDDDSDSGLEVGSHSEEDEEESSDEEMGRLQRRRRNLSHDSDSQEESASPPPIPFRPRRQEDPPSLSISSDSEESEEEAPVVRRKKRVIAEDESD